MSRKLDKTVRVKAPTHKHAQDWMARGYQYVAGIDEVGRGCWAGPVVTAAVILPARIRLAGVHDSKLLTPARRAEQSVIIKRQALAIGIGWVSAADIDAFGLTWAVCQSGLRALKSLHHPYDAVLLDGNHNYLVDHCYSETIIKGDQLSLSIAAASIIAKVARDRYMAVLARNLPGYHFELHKGYGTALHRQALETLGPSPVHRRSWLPLRELSYVNR